MSSSGDKGSFKTDLPKEILDAALDAVKKRQSASGVEVDLHPEADAGSPDQPEAPAAANDGDTTVIRSPGWALGGCSRWCGVTVMRSVCRWRSITYCPGDFCDLGDTARLCGCRDSAGP